MIENKNNVSHRVTNPSIPLRKGMYTASKQLRGIFLLDIEIELAWGIIDKKINLEKIRKASLRAKKCLEDLIYLLEKYEIPVTWGILGHTMMNHCERESGVPHSEMPRPSYEWLKKDWYFYDPCKKLTEEPAFYGKDIVDKIINYSLETKIPHDIAIHSFSHVLFGNPGCSEEVAEAEIERCLELMEQNHNTIPKVFVFPRGDVGHLDVLRRKGMIAFVGSPPHAITYSESSKRPWNLCRKYALLTSYWISFYLGIPPPVIYPKKEDGLINIPPSMCYNKKAFIPLQLIVLKAKKGIDRAVRERKIFHLFTHLINFGQAPNRERFLRGLEEILAYVHMHRIRGELETTTVRRVAEVILREGK